MSDCTVWKTPIHTSDHTLSTAADCQLVRNCGGATASLHAALIWTCVQVCFVETKCTITRDYQYLPYSASWQNIFPCPDSKSLLPSTAVSLCSPPVFCIQFSLSLTLFTEALADLLSPSFSCSLSFSPSLPLASWCSLESAVIKVTRYIHMYVDTYGNMWSKHTHTHPAKAELRREYNGKRKHNLPL